MEWCAFPTVGISCLMVERLLISPSNLNMDTRVTLSKSCGLSEPQ